MSIAQTSRPGLPARLARWLRRRVFNDFMTGWCGALALTAFTWRHDWVTGTIFVVIFLVTAVGTAKWAQR